MVFVPDVAAKVKTPAPATTDIPVEAFKSPYMVGELLLNEPENPVGFVPSVKSKFLTDCELVIAKEPVPAVILNEILLDSVTAVGVSVLNVALLLVRIICGVPVTVMVVAPVNTVPVLFSEMVFVPKASVPVKPVIVRV